MIATMSVLYDTLGQGYAQRRRPDPRIAAAIDRALGDARTVVNVGAGAGSYEPADRSVVAVEPSATMLAQRPERAAPAIRATAEALPFAPRSFDASLAVLTHHHWSDWRAGMRELVRVARRRVVIFTHDPLAPAFHDFWLIRDYLPALAAVARRGLPAIAELCASLDGKATIVPVPAGCADGFLAAYWRRPEQYLKSAARDAISAFHRLPRETLDEGLGRLAADLATGAWAHRNAGLLHLDTVDLGYRLIVADVGVGRARDQTREAERPERA